MATIGIVLHGLGTLLIGWMALSVHRVVGQERTFDKKVVTALRHERTLGIIGMILIAAGLAMQIAARV
ncbi:hypothetical protein HY523_02795 [Candidatus Berkelbacteria bacterium]|nr:hypothetical protein [Candidatus Berkelbacteria bacterium]